MTAYRKAVLADGAVAYWPFNTGDSSETDIVGGKVAVLSGAAGQREVPYPGEFARDLNGSATFFEVSAPDSVGLTWMGGDYTVEWWSLSDSLGQDAIISQRFDSTGSTSQGLSIMAGTADPGVIAIDMGASGTRASVGGYAFAVGQWRHHVFTWEQATSTRRFYVDGSQVYGHVGTNNTPPTTQPPIRIGSLGGNTSYAWDGLIGGIGLYQKRLLPEQIKAHFLASGAKGKRMLLGGQWRHKPVLRKSGDLWVPTAIPKPTA